MVNREAGRQNGRIAAFNLFPRWFITYRKNKKEKPGDMSKRFLSIWFRYLKTDWVCRRQPNLLTAPFILATPDHGRIVVTDANIPAQKQGIDTGTVVADARAIYPGIQVFDDKPELAEQILKAIGKY